MKLTAQHFTAVDKRFASVETFIPYLNKYLEVYGINTWQRLSAFLAQIAWESDWFRTTKEYATGAAYEGRKDLGNINKGDGVKFKGRGLIQLTGRSNYRDFTNWYCSTDFETYPEFIEKPELAVLASIFYWDKHNLNQYADKLQFDEITRIINGGTNHAAERKETWLKTLEICKQIINS